MKTVQIHNGHFLILERGEQFFPTVVAFCEQNEIHWAQFSGIGAVENVEIGYYDLPNRQYVWRQEAGPFEVAVTLEICLWEVTQPLLREYDDDTGLNLISVSV